VRIFLTLVVLLVPLRALCLEEGSSLSLRTYHPSGAAPGFRSLYLAAKLRLIFTEDTTAHLTLKKGSGEPGCYPAGWFGDAASGLWEQGTWFLHLKNRLGTRRIIVGNYFPLFGQGLLYGGSFPLLLSSPYYDLPRHRDGVYPTTTTSKSVLLEGVAVEIESGPLLIRPFVSWNRYDCSAGESDYYQFNDNDADGIPNDEDPFDFDGADPAFPEGYSCKNHLAGAIRSDADYGTASDRAKRNNLAEFIAGLNLSTEIQDLRLGWTGSYTRYSRLVDPYYDFDPGEGDKTSWYFRGKDYLSTSLYFKLYRPVEVFGEVAGTCHRSLSYYPEFNGNIVSAFAWSGGVRGRIGDTGVILWGSYVPGTLVNPHGQEYPGGLNNRASGLAGVNRAGGGRRFSAWVHGYRELRSPDGPALCEAGLSCGQRARLPLAGKHRLYLEQSAGLVDHHYYAPEELSLRLVSEVAPSFRLSDHLELRCALETRAGGPLSASLFGGAAITPELVRRSESSRGSASLTLFFTHASRFASVYPYQRPLDTWSFMPRALNGKGLAGSVQWVRRFTGSAVLGARVAGELYFGDPGRGRAVLYLVSSIPL
jgi:hypothetical protein